MNIAEVKAMAPEADVYALTPEAKYLIVIEKQMISGNQMVSLCQRLADDLGIAAMILSVAPGQKDSLKIYEDRNSD